MPYKYNDPNIFPIRRHSYKPGPKKILIELSELSIFVISSVILYKAFSILWPEYVAVPNNIPELLLSLPNILRAHPAITGVLLSFMTWHVMYLDSAVPGINPPTPLSPKKYRTISGADFHFNFLFALLVGPLTAALLYSGCL